MKLVLACCLCLALAACATSMSVTQQTVTPDGQPTTYVQATTQVTGGSTFTVIDRYQGGKIVRSDSSSNGGPMSGPLPTAVSTMFGTASNAALMIEGFK